jgi:predicted kinase
MTPTLYFTTGIPGSGKSTVCERAAKNGVKVVSRDVIRNEFGQFTKDKERCVVEICKNMVQAYLLNGQSVVFDSTALHTSDRMRIVWWAKELFATGRVPHDLPIICYYLSSNLEDAIKRREGKISAENMRSMAKRLVEPKQKEGFKLVTVLDPLSGQVPKDEERYVPLSDRKELKEFQDAERSETET